jgi:N,N-dimethylformamidase beta subunit-like protein/NHL repeat-containing protein
MSSRFSRREFLIAAGGALAASCGGQRVASGEVVPGVPLAPDPVKPPDPVTPPPRASPHVNLVPAENALAGAVDWRLQVGAPAHEIEGYALRQSAMPGEAVAVAVSCSSGAAAFHWTLYRLGYYGGVGARAVASGDAVAPAQRAPSVDRTTGLVTCGWRPAFTLVTDVAWATGLHLLKLVRADGGYDAWVPLVLRDARPSAEILVVVPTATWQAYNFFGGESLYQDDAALTGSGRAFQVSYDRPYAQDFGAGNALRWDHRLVQFLEAQGEDVAYATDEDLDRDPALAARARVVILSAHDEYWSGGVRRALDAAVAGGTSLLLFGANAGYWQVRYGAATDGRDRRVITCYKDDAPRLDPAGPSSPDLTVRFRDDPVSHPENALFGVMFQTWNTYGFPLAPVDPTHWAFAGTGLAPGDALPLVAGYEIDDTFDNGATPAGVEVLGEAAFLPVYGDHVARGRMVVRTEGSAVVFAAGGVDFTSALAGDTADPRVQRIAANVLGRALGRAAPDHLVTSQGVAGAPQGPFASAVKTIAGAAFSPGDDDGGRATGRLRQPVAVAACADGSVAILDVATSALRRLDAAGVLATLPSPGLLSPTGLAADALGNLYVADTGRACIRKRTAAGVWSVVAGAPGLLGAKLGPGATARFMAPAGLALKGTSLYVADIGANAVCRIDLADPALTVTAVGPTIIQPSGVAVAADGTVYAIEGSGFRVAALSGTTWKTMAGGRPGFADGRADAARLLPQLGLAVLPDGALAVSDTGNFRVRVIRAGTVTTLAGSGHPGTREGTGDATDLSIPTGLAVDKLGRLLVADTGTSVVRLITP